MTGLFAERNMDINARHGYNLVESLNMQAGTKIRIRPVIRNEKNGRVLPAEPAFPLLVEHNAESGPFVGFGPLDKYFPAVVILNDSFGERKTQTPSPLLGGVAWFKNGFEP